MKLTQLLLLGVLGTGFTVSGNSAYGQLNKEYQRGIQTAEQCKKDYYPNAQYEGGLGRMLVRGNKVYKVNLYSNGECVIKYQADLGKTKQDCLSGNGLTACSQSQWVIESSELIWYYKDWFGDIDRRVYTRR